MVYKADRLSPARQFPPDRMLDPQAAAAEQALAATGCTSGAACTCQVSGCLCLLHAQPYRMLGPELGGAVFSCSHHTQDECLALGLLGTMQDAYVPIVANIRPGMPVRNPLCHTAVYSGARQMQCAVTPLPGAPDSTMRAKTEQVSWSSFTLVQLMHAVPLRQVFLLNYMTKKLLGPFAATSSGALEIDPAAWARRGHRTPWPAQACTVPLLLPRLTHATVRPRLFSIHPFTCFRTSISAGREQREKREILW